VGAIATEKALEGCSFSEGTEQSITMAWNLDETLEAVALTFRMEKTIRSELIYSHKIRPFTYFEFVEMGKRPCHRPFGRKREKQQILHNQQLKLSNPIRANGRLPNRKHCSVAGLWKVRHTGRPWR
jgi:hypothetical protein